ncbi:MAG: hypothetical protein ABSG49_03770 [Methanoregula sp.]|jgi:hypothetical protein|uniref:hypothetical protein n=1 Tax=Methanoregula sp. TaxID=2052170 RepID=UPI003C23D884
MLPRTSSPRLKAKHHRIVARGGGRHFYNVSIHTRPVRRELRAGLRTGGVMA